jgi:hypothetical protein
MCGNEDQEVLLLQFAGFFKNKNVGKVEDKVSITQSAIIG